MDLAKAAEASFPTLVDEGKVFLRMRRTQASGGSNSTADGGPCLAGSVAALDVGVVLMMHYVSMDVKRRKRAIAYCMAWSVVDHCCRSEAMRGGNPKPKKSHSSRHLCSCRYSICAPLASSRRKHENEKTHNDGRNAV